MFIQVGNSEVSAFPFAAAGRLQRGSAASFRAASPLSVSSANGPWQWEGANSLSQEAPCPLMINLCELLQLRPFLTFCLPVCLSVFPNSPVLVLMKLLKFTTLSYCVYLSKHAFPPFFFLSLSCISSLFLVFPGPCFLLLYLDLTLLPMSEQLSTRIAKETS